MKFHRTNINLYEEDVEWLKKRFGYGWSEQVREWIRKRITDMITDKEPFGRQPQSVSITATGDPQDVEFYLRRIKSLIESSTYDNCVIQDNTLVIYPGAVND